MEKDNLQTLTLGITAIAFGSIGFVQPIANGNWNEMNVVFAIVSVVLAVFCIKQAIENTKS